MLLMKYICFVKWLKMYRIEGCEAGLNYLDFCQAILMNVTFFLRSIQFDFQLAVARLVDGGISSAQKCFPEY